MKGLRLDSVLNLSSVVLALAFSAAAPARADISIAEDLVVDLDAQDLPEGPGPDQWVSAGSLGDFVKVSDPLGSGPMVETIAGAKAVTFNADTAVGDSYQSLDVVPPGLVGPDPTRTIEAWVYNPLIPQEETIVSWGHRGAAGGPINDGMNMSFNYGTNPLYGAVGHWNLNFQDIGWNPVPVAAQWHHLVYTYDGTTTRVYVDGVLNNSEFLDAGAINTHSGMPIALAQQYLADGVGFEPALPGRLSIGKLRVHDGVLDDAQVLNNYSEERPRFPFEDRAPSFLDAPADDTVIKGISYSRTLRVSAYPLPTLDVQPPGATTSQSVTDSNGEVLVVYDYTPPDPPPASFQVKVKATNSAGSSEVTWTVAVKNPTGTIEVAEDLVVDLDARDFLDGPAPEIWTNHGSMGDFQLYAGSESVVETIYDARAVTFNRCASNDAYQSINDAPEGILGIDATASIEAWVLNPSIANEETVLAWGKRGGPDGTNMSFNYGSNVDYGAVGHWGVPDLGWGAVPVAGQWHHLVYTFDGAIQRVYSDGLQTAFENLGPGVVNVFTPAKVNLAVQTEPDGFADRKCSPQRRTPSRRIQASECSSSAAPTPEPRSLSRTTPWNR